jgi:glycosyltransferase involved in cell wall biosynthesis
MTPLHLNPILDIHAMTTLAAIPVQHINYRPDFAGVPSSAHAPRVSVVINTYNRAATLPQALLGLAYQTYSNFEVIVVNGPSTDGTDALLQQYTGKIRLAKFPEANLSKSRNIGIIEAAGSIVVFIDDDAIPDPRYLEGIVAGYTSKAVGGVGGIVYDNTGYTLQGAPPVCDRRANPHFDLPPPYWEFQVPQGDGFVHLIGCNSSFRREALAAVGGFDEEIEYFLDETELCMRLVDHGYALRLLDDAAVYHKFAPSHLRGENKVLRKPFPVIKNKFYVALRCARAQDRIFDVLEDCRRFANEQLNGAKWHHSHGRMTDSELAAFEEDVERGTRVGIDRAMNGKRSSVVIPPADPSRFLKYPTLAPDDRRMTICLVTQDLPHENPGGIGRYTWDTAVGFAAKGHEVHVISRSRDHNRVDFEDGVWTHRILDDTDGFWNAPDLAGDLRKNLGRAAAVHREVLRIGSTRPIDAVVVPIWDAEGLFCIMDDRLPTILSLQTTMKTFVEIHPSWDSPELQSLVAVERQMVTAAKRIHAISAAILQKVQTDYNIMPDCCQSVVVPLGIADRSWEFHRRRSDDRLRILFVGRLEKRKGVDVLLEAAINLVEEFPHVEFVLAGDDSIPTEEGPSYRAQFERRYADESAAQRVIFKGRVSDEELHQHYADCDIFCSPSRYESFGLVFLEAMAFGKPVVGCKAGGQMEVIQDGVNGRLCPVDDAAALATALRQLITDDQQRAAFGAASRQIYEASFSVEKMVDNTLTAYHALVAS